MVPVRANSGVKAVHEPPRMLFGPQAAWAQKHTNAWAPNTSEFIASVRGSQAKLTLHEPCQ